MTELDELLAYPVERIDPLLPPPCYRQLRQQPPVRAQLPGGKRAWLLTRHEDVKAALTDPRLSSDFLQPNFPALNPMPPAPGAFSFFRMDGAEHNRLRRMVVADFTPRRIRQLRPTIDRLTDSLLDEMAAGPRPVDLVEAFALRLPSLVIAEILGVPPEDRELFQRNSQTIISADAGIEAAMAAYGELTGYLAELASAKQRQPADDVISKLVTQYEAAGELTRFELVAMAALVLFAGHETTANQIGLSVVYLLQHPDQLAEVRREPALLAPAVEELLRHASIKQHDLIRVAAEDVELAGVPIRAGEGVVCAMPSANHDERVFPDPDRLDVHRQARGHLAFGHGVHACLGAALARTEIEVALGRLFDRFPGLRLAAEVAELPFRHTMLIYGISSIPVTW